MAPQQPICQICGTRLPTLNAKRCPTCILPQTRIQGWLDSYPHLTALLQFLAAALLIPLALWLVSNQYAERQNRARDAEARYAEVTRAIPQLRAARSQLFEACLGLDVEVCAGQVSTALGKYHQARSESRDAIARHLPQLMPTVTLLSSVRVGRAAQQGWATYFRCLDGGAPPESCEQRRSSVQRRALGISRYLVEYLECVVHTSTARDRELESSRYCKVLVDRRRPLAWERPAAILKGFDGLELPKGLDQVAADIWCEEVIPARGWEDSSCLGQASAEGPG